MATKPGSDLTSSDHSTVGPLGDPHESPEVWGWHAEWGKWTAVGGWVCVVILLLMMTSTHYNGQGILFLGLSALALVVGLMIDRQRRKKAWRKS